MFSDFLKFHKNNSFKLDKLGKHWLLGYSNPRAKSKSKWN